MTSVEMTAAIGIASFGVWEMYNSYTRMAPSLHTLRNADAYDNEARQALRDTDICVGGVAILAGISVSFLSRSNVPLILSLLAFAFISCYHHTAFNGPTVSSLEGM